MFKSFSILLLATAAFWSFAEAPETAAIEAARRNSLELIASGRSPAAADPDLSARETALPGAVCPVRYVPKWRLDGDPGKWAAIPTGGEIATLSGFKTRAQEKLRPYFKAVFDDEYLYLLLAAEDARLHFGVHHEPYENDCFEIFIDPSFSRSDLPRDDYLQLFVTAADTAGKDLRTTGKVQFRAVPVAVPGGWGAEAAIPLDNEWFKAAPFDGFGIGFNVSYDNNDFGRGRDDKFSWSSLDLNDGSYGNPALLGALVFVHPSERPARAVAPGRELIALRSRRGGGETVADPDRLAEFRPEPAMVRGFQLGGFDREKLQAVRDMGCTAVRVQLQAIAPQPTWTEENYPLLLDSLEEKARMARQVGIKLIPTLFEYPGVTPGETAWGNPAFEVAVIRYWRGIAERLLPYREVIWGYDLLNEPLERTQLPLAPEEWRPLAIRILRAIREVDPETWIVYETGPGGSARGFDGLLPLPDYRVIYSCHFYEPGAFTHQGIAESYLQDPGLMAKAQEEAGISYPGLIGGKHWDREQLERELHPAVEFQRRYRTPIYLGEFSTVAWAPPESSRAWLEDIIGLFEKYGWSWTYHAIYEWQGWDPRVFEGTLTGAENLLYGDMDETVRGRVLLEAFAAGEQ